jgi:hypothetical protein
MRPPIETFCVIPLVVPDIRWTLVFDKCGNLRLGFLPRNSAIYDHYPYVRSNDLDSHFSYDHQTTSGIQ